MQGSWGVDTEVKKKVVPSKSVLGKGQRMHMHIQLGCRGERAEGQKSVQIKQMAGRKVFTGHGEHWT